MPEWTNPNKSHWLTKLNLGGVSALVRVGSFSGVSRQMCVPHFPRKSFLTQQSPHETHWPTKLGCVAIRTLVSCDPSLR